MLNKKIIISLIFVMFLVGIGCVSAENMDDIGNFSSGDVADDSVSLDDGMGDTIEDVESDVSTNGVDDDVISDGEPTRSTDTWGHFKAEVENTGNSIVKLNQSNIAPSSSSSDQINLNHNVTIVGGYGYYIGSANWGSAPIYNYIPIVTSADNLNVKFENVTFQYLSNNVFMKLMGDGNFTFKNCVFKNMNGTAYKQSAIWLYQGYALIDNCTFTDCKFSFGAVTNCYSSSPDTVNYARMTVKDSTFSNNIASWEPGCINNCGYLEVYNSTFEDNSASWWAGAIHTHNYANTTIFRSTFKNNKAGWNGGALYAYSDLQVYDSTFIGNNCTGQYGGGAIGASNRVRVTIDNCTFKNNNAPKSKGGAIYVTGAGYLNVTNSDFINNSAPVNYGMDIAYEYTGSSSTAAYFNYYYNDFYGANNATYSIYTSNSYLNVNGRDTNHFHDIGDYVEPGDENDTNTSGSVVPIPSGTTIGNQLWNASLSGALGGTPLVVGDRIYVPNGRYVYCLNITNGDLLWNVSSPWDYPGFNYFHDLGLHNGVLIAPCDFDKLYFINATNGNEVQSGILEGSSYYAPLIVGNTIYMSSNSGWGDNNASWIAVIEYNNGVYSYVDSILEINNVSSALISAPVLWNGYLWVNTVKGLMRVDLSTGVGNVILNDTVGKIVVGGDYLYILTGSNHIRGINTNSIVDKDIAVGGNVGSTLAISNDNSTLYTVNANGEIYRWDVTSTSADFVIGQNVNPVSSAFVVGSDGNLYIGDDAGIFWIIKVFYSFSHWRSSVSWAYNASSPIHGTPVIDNGSVYIGTEDTFYKLSNASISYLPNENNLILSIYQNSLSNYDLLGVYDVNEILNEPTPRDINSKRLTYEDFMYSNSVYYLNNGTYYGGMYFVIGSDGLNGVNNIIIKANTGSNVTIVLDTDNSEYFFEIMQGKNITIENIKFTTKSGVVITANGQFLYMHDQPEVTFKNCTFENIVRPDSRPNMLLIESGNIKFDGCNFINCISQMPLYITGGSVCLSNCTFENCTFKGGSIVPIVLNGGKVVSSIFKVLTETLIVGKEGSIDAELVDDNGNRIKSSNLKFVINNDPTGIIAPDSNGLYTVKYTPQAGTDKIYVLVECSDVENLEDDNDPILVKSITTLVVDCNASGVYGAEFKVNATLDSTISGEKITFTVFNSTNDPVKSVNTTITDGFASYSFTDLPVGEYTVVADYAGGASFVSATGNKTFTITQAESSVEIVVLNDIIHVGEAIKVKANVPAGATGNVTFTINNDETVNVGEVATFEGLPNGTYTIYAVYNGDANYKASKKVNTTITVVKYDANLNVDADDVDYGNPLVVKVTTDANFTGEVLVKVGDKNQTANITKGMGNATFDGLTAAEYNITAIFSENDMFNADVKNTTATVRSVVPADQAFNTDVPANSQSPTFSIKLDKDATGNFTVIIDDGKTFNKTVELKNGSASITADNLAVGNHNVVISYSGDGKHAPITKNTTVTIKEPDKPAPKVTKKATKIVAKKKTFKAKKKVKKYTITLKSGNTLLKKVKVTLKIKGKTYKATTNNKGKATFKIKNLKKKGKYTATIKFAGNANYKPTSKKVKITVKK